MTFGSLFAGIGGFDLALENVGMTCSWQSEINKWKIKVLERHFPSVKRFGDIRENIRDFTPVDLVCGGDPCPCRSRARGRWPSRSPDLSGYFLAVASRLRPRWVVRENVLAPDVFWFVAGLEACGYRCVVLNLDSRDFTGQSRNRQYVCGCLDVRSASAFERIVLLESGYRRAGETIAEKEAPVVACITTHRNRMAAEDTYCFEPGIGLRILSSEEAEALQGFPGDWTTGFSERSRRAMLGDAVTVPAVQWIGQRILETEKVKYEIM